MFRIKSKIRAALGNTISFRPETELKQNRSRIVERQIVKNLILSESDLSTGLRSQTPGCLLRVLASGEEQARLIAKLLDEHKDELTIRSVHLADRALEFFSKRNEPSFFSHSVIIKVEPKSLLKSATSTLLTDRRFLLKEVNPNLENKPEKLVIDFSSPNIAKPFHFGHLKSTILGNYLANLNEFLGSDVTRLNYIGDWGTQYGLLSLGLERFGGLESLSVDGDAQSSPLRHLLNTYVMANQQAQLDDAFNEESRRRFRALDCDKKDDRDSELLHQWLQIRDLSLRELKQSYARLNIKFDVFDYESRYANCQDKILSLLDPTNVLCRQDGVTIAYVEKNNRDIEVPLIKSDGTTLYLTRDLAAALSRYDSYAYDRMLYVVGADQERHFYSLSDLTNRMSKTIARSQLVHVKTGKVLGMSTRSGKFELLSDIIDETSRRYAESTRQTPTTKTINEREVEHVSQQLALSALFVYDMCKPRTQNYEFSWTDVMEPNSWSGLNLQATYARLCSLINKAKERGLDVADESELSADSISCVEALNLLSELDDFDLAIHNSYWLMDPQPLVSQALRVCRAANRARQSSRLQIITEKHERWAKTKLLMFERARNQLELTIKLIGLQPLERV